MRGFPMKEKFIRIIALLSAAVMLSGCDIVNTESVPNTQTEPLILTEAPEPQPYPVIIGGIEIEKQPSKIVSLSPAITEMLAEMGYNGRLCAIGSYCDYPIGIEQLENAGSIANPDIDKVIALGADMLITTAPIASKDTVILESKGITPLILTPPHTLTELEALYKSLGTILDGEIVGAEYGEKAFKKIKDAAEKAGPYNVGKFIYITIEEKLSAKDTFENDVLSLFGENLMTADGYLSAENADFTTQPDIVFCSDEFTLEQLQANSVYGALDVVKNGNVIFVENKLFERPSGRIAQLIAGICQSVDNSEI